MCIDQNEVGIAAQLCTDQRPVQCGKHRIIRCHEQIGHYVDHRQAGTGGIGDMHNTLAGRALSHVQRAQQAWFLCDVINDLTLVPDMIAGGQHIDASREQRIANLRRHAEPASCVLAIDYQKIQFQLIAQPRRGIDNRIASAATHNVTKKQNPHHPVSTRRSPAGVSAPSSFMSWGPVGTRSVCCSS